MIDIGTRNFNVNAAALDAIRWEFGPQEVGRRLLGVWVQPNGLVALHLDSIDTAFVVARALRRYDVNMDLDSEHRVLLWVP